MLGQFPAMVVATDLRDSTRDVVVESKDKVACGACGRRLRRPRCYGKRAFCTASVDAEGIARVFHSTGRVHRPARARRERRGRDRARCSVRCRCRSRAHVVSFLVSTSNNEGTKQKRKRQTRTDEGRTDEGRRTEQTITSPTKDFSLQVAGAANRSRTMPTSAFSGQRHRSTGRLEPGGSVAGVAGRDRARCSVRCRCRSRAHVAISFRVSNLKQRRDETETETTNKNGSARPTTARRAGSSALTSRGAG